MKEPQTSFDNWQILSQEYLEEFKSKATHLRHKSGFEVFHLHNENPENLFAFTFKTLPHNDTGVAHILEHTVLCGSEKYPVKDPFLNLLKSSLNTFLNAFTFPDKTVYLASSCVEKDFYNLMRVYSDSVFNPLLKEEAFAQEGWHFKINEEDKLDVSGIVFNEMKGVYSSEEAIIQEESIHSLFKKSLYRFDSGGNPKAIPSLTYEEFKKFHEDFYHPSQTKLFLFGDISLEKHINFIEKEILDPKGSLSPKNIPVIEKEPRWNKPEFKTLLVPPSEDSNLSHILINWLTCDISETEDVIGLEILIQILLSDASPLVLKLLEEEIGEDISPLCGYESEIRDTILSLGMRGVKEDKKELFYPLVREILQEMVEKGIDKELVEGILFNFNFSSREIKGSGQGLRLMHRTLRGWLHELDPKSSLVFKSHLQEIEKKHAQGHYFEGLIEKYLLNNPHHSILTFDVDLDYEEKNRKQFEEWLLKKEKEWIPKKKEEIIKLNEQLKIFQETPDSENDLSTLPLLKKEDLPHSVRPMATIIPFDGKETISLISLPTNGIIYINLAFSLKSLAPESFSYLGLVHRAWDSLGTKNYSQSELEKKIRLIFGRFSFNIQQEADLEGSPVPYLFLQAATTEEKAEEGLALIKEILLEPNFNNEQRLKELLLELKNDFSSSLTHHGHQYASLRGMAKVDPTSSLKERVSGISAYEFWVEKTDNIKKALKELPSIFKELKDKLLNKKSTKAFLVGEEKAITLLAKKVEDFIYSLPEKEINTFKVDLIKPENKQEAILLKTKVNFNALILKGFSIEEENFPASLFLAHLLKSNQLWNKIRMKGGAYGASATSHGMRVFTFSSYRDPHTQKTFDAFKESLEEIANKSLSDLEIYTTLIGMLGSDLAPISPQAYALLSFKLKERGITNKLRQDIRDAYFKLNSQDIQKVAKSLLERQDKIEISLTSEFLLQKEPIKGNIVKISL